jgi:tetratricopeptide (TPR) repeat protein
VARSRALFLTAIASLATLAVYGQAAGEQKQGEQKGPQFKDRAEYDLYEAVRTGTDAKKRLEVLNQWKEKYPQSEFEVTRRTAYVTTYQQLGQAEEMWNACKDLLAADPKNFTALYFLTLLVKSMGKTDPDRLDTGEKAARTLLQVVETPPAGVAAAEWEKQKPAIQVAAHTSLGWVAMNRKDNAGAEKEFTKVLEMSPGNGEVSVLLGTVIRQQNNADRYSEVLFHFARAGNYDGPGALAPAGRQQYHGFFEKAYVKYHGSKNEMDEVIKVAKASALPPKDFKIESFIDIKNREAKELWEKNPQLAFWRDLKTALTDEATASTYWEAMKGTAVPGDSKPEVKKLKGKVISLRPPLRPKEIVLGIESADTPEVTLRLEQPYPNRAEVGTELEFSGVAADLVRDPFMLTFEVEKEDIVGWPPPPKPAPKAPKSGAKKKG